LGDLLKGWAVFVFGKSAGKGLQFEIQPGQRTIRQTLALSGTMESTD